MSWFGWCALARCVDARCVEGMTMATRADEVAARFEAINGELIAAVEGCSDE